MDWQIRRNIADAILQARILKLPTARAAYEQSVGMPVSDKLWAELEPQWQWHFDQPQSDLQAAVNQGS